MKTEIVKIENGIIECPVVDEQRYIAIKPVCELMGISYHAQTEALKNHPTFASTIRLIETVGADNKQREMLCISFKRFLLWLGGIHPNKVKEEAKEGLMKYQELISDILFEKFVEEPEFYKMKSEQKDRLREQLDLIDESRDKLRKQLKQIDSLTWEDFKANNRQLKLSFEN